MSDSSTDELGFTALLPLDDAARVAPQAVRAAFAAVAPRSALELAEAGPADCLQAFVADVDGQPLACALFGGPAPEPDLSRAAGQSIFWRGAAQEVEGHRAFLAVAAVGRAAGQAAACAQAAALTRLVAALCETLPARAVLWHEAGTLSAAARLVRAARELGHGRWPVDVWLGCRLRGDDPATPTVITLRSRGAAAFFGAELEAPHSPAGEKKEPLRILYGAAGFLMSHPQALDDAPVIEVRGERRAEFRVETDAGQPGLARLVPVAGTP